jgi:hypothetical protein
MFGSPTLKQDVEASIRAADVVTVTTEALREKYAKMNPRTAIAPNALDLRMTRPLTEQTLPVRVVSWRGGDSHIDDLALFHDAILAGAWAFEASWKFFGHSPYKLLGLIPELTAISLPFTDLWTHYAQFAAAKPSIVIVPLRKTHFNACKSPIAMIEALWAGAVPLVPRWSEWLAPGGELIPGVEYYGSPLEFSQKLVVLGKTPLEELARRAAEGLAWVRQNLSIGKVNVVRALALQNLSEQEAGTVEVPRTHGIEIKGE